MPILRFTESEARAKLGKRVRALIKLPGVPKGTTGKVTHTIRGDLKVEWEIGKGKKPADWFNREAYERCLQEIGQSPPLDPENVLPFPLSFFTREEADAKVGERVKTLVDLSGFPTVPKGTTGRVVRTEPGAQFGFQLKSYDVVVRFDLIGQMRFRKDEYKQMLIEVQLQ